MIDIIFHNLQNPHFLPEVLEPDEYGCVFVGGELSVPAVIEAYMRGCFPWTGTHPIPWCSPDPRLVLFPEDFKASRRLLRLDRQKKFDILFDNDFHAVIENCARISRRGQKGTWITKNMITVYCELFDLHIAHSIEVYENGVLCGGLYGLTFGRAFFGESMFSSVPNTSKLALYALCRFLAKKNFDFIDCQEVSLHLMRLGAVTIGRSEYLMILRHALLYESIHESWKQKTRE